jgi:hypothetical protein
VKDWVFPLFGKKDEYFLCLVRKMRTQEELERLLPADP